MNGPNHYRAAEKLLLSCQVDRYADGEYYPAVEDGVNSVGNGLAAAQVHATLALAAATAEPGGSPFVPAEWADVIRS